MGCLVDGPALYADLTAWQNLKVQCLQRGLNEADIAPTLQLVGLKDTGSKPAGKFSLGMRQRLGLAVALLGKPEFLVLDEPLNGLDPEGIHSIRELLLQLHQEGKTVFLSSHLLDEVEKTCTHVGILQHGCLLYQGDLSELLNSIEKRIHIRLDKVDLLHSVCKEVQIDSRIKSESILEVILSNDTTYDRLIELLGQGGYHISAIQPLENTLESVYLKLTSQTK